MSTKQLEMYLLHCPDKDLYKIGYRSVGNVRFTNKGSFSKNGYGFNKNISQVYVSGPCDKKVIVQHEKILHSLYQSKNTPYVLYILNETKEGMKVFEHRPNGYKEWFSLSPSDVVKIKEYYDIM